MRGGGGGDFSGSIFYMIFIVSPSICSLLVSIVLFVTKCFYCTRKGYTEFRGGGTCSGVGGAQE